MPSVVIGAICVYIGIDFLCVSLAVGEFVSSRGGTLVWHSSGSHRAARVPVLRACAAVFALSADIWDTAGQERFNKMHPAYYHRANACILVFDVTRKQTYQHLTQWCVCMMHARRERLRVLS